MNNRLYLYVKAFSDLGSRMDMIVLGALMYAETHSVVWLSMSLAIGMLGGVVAGFFSGVLADRLDRRKIMIISDVLRAVFLLLIVLSPAPWTILLVRFLLGVMNSVFEVSYKAEVPVIYGETRLLNTNALISRLGSISMVVGFLGGGALSHWVGFSAVLIFDACTYLFSALAIQLMNWQSTRNSQQSEQPFTFRQWVSDFKEVKAYLYLRPALALIMGIYFMDTFGSGSHNLGIPLLADQLDPDRQAFYYGTIWAIWAFGNVVGSYILPRISSRLKDMNTFFFVSTVCMSVGFICIFSSPTIPLIFVAACLTGVFDSFSMTTGMTLFQQTDNRVRGRVFGVSMLLNNLGFGLGFVVAPLLLKVLSLTHMVIVMHTVVIVAALGAILYHKVGVRRAKLNLNEGL